MKDDADAPEELRARALRLLAHREHSRAELERKLGPHAGSSEIVTGILEALVQNKQLSDERYAEQRVHQLARKFGAGRIARELRAKGVDDETIASSVSEARASELERARAIWLRKFRSPATSPKENAKQTRFLQSRGFSSDVIYTLLKDKSGDI